MLQNSKETGVFPYTKYSHKYELIEDYPIKEGKKLRLYRGVETIVRNICSYKVPELVGTNTSTN